MSICSDSEIAYLAKNHGMIEPFVNQLVSRVDDKNVISYGLSSYGYDMRLSRQFSTFGVDVPLILDPKKRGGMQVTNEHIHVIPPHGFVLGLSVEYFRIPRDVMVVCVGKSTYARCGIIVNVTPLEPEWEGCVVIEISNTTNVSVMVYADEGIAQLLFFKGERPCSCSYADREGKYQYQKEIVGAIV